MKSDPHSRALDALRRLVRAIVDNAHELNQETGITSAQRFLMEQLADKAAPTVNALARQSHTSQATVVVVLNRLEKRGLVARQTDPADRRRTIVTLTRAGRQLVSRSSAPVQVKLIKALAQMPERKVQSLATLLEAWLKEANLEHVHPTLFLEPRAARTRQDDA